MSGPNVANSLNVSSHFKEHLGANADLGYPDKELKQHLTWLLMSKQGRIIYS